MAIESKELLKFHLPPSSILGNPFGECAGAASVFDLQLSELAPGVDFRPLGAPFIAFELSLRFSD